MTLVLFRFLTIFFNVNLTSARIETQIGVFAAESHLEFGYGNGSSNSDFWKDPGRQEPFGAVCINIVAKHCTFLKGLELAITDTTLNEMIRHGGAEVELRSLGPSLGRTTFFGNFQWVEEIKSAERLTEFSIDAHIRVGWKMIGIISHTTDSATNAIAGAQEMKFLTKEEWPVEVYMMKCMPHKASTSAMASSGTSNRVENLSLEAVEILKNVTVYQSESIRNVPDVNQRWQYTRQISVRSILSFRPE